MVAERSEEDPNNHSFHIPNAFSRSEYRQTAAYQALAREDIDGDAAGPLGGAHGTVPETATIDDVGVADESGANAVLIGVESLDCWRCMSAWQRVCLRMSFGVLGASVLLPFNAIITPSEFYRTLLKNTPHQASFMSWIVVAYNVSCIVFGAHATASMHRKSISQRIVSSTLIIILILALTVALSSMVARDNGSPSGYALPLILLLVTILAAATSYLQIAVVTLSNAYGPAYLGTMLAGQGLVGAVVSVVQLIAAYANAGASTVNDGLANRSEARAAVWFYATNTAFMALTLVMFWRLTSNATYGQVQARISRSKYTRLASAESVEQVAEQGGGTGTVRGIRRYMSPSIEALYDRITKTQRKTFLASASIAYVFVVTLAVFPSLTSRVRPSKMDVKDQELKATTLVFVAWHFLAFNASDLLGRSLPAMAPNVFCLRHMRILAMLCMLRTALVPLLAACNVPPSTASPTSKVVVVAAAAASSSSPFPSGLFFFLVTILGFTNGLLATNIFIAGPRQPVLETDAERDLAAGLLSWWLTLGLALGSFFSFFVSNA